VSSDTSSFRGSCAVAIRTLAPIALPADGAKTVTYCTSTCSLSPGGIRDIRDICNVDDPRGKYVTLKTCGSDSSRQSAQSSPRKVCDALKPRAAKTELQSQVKRLRIGRLDAYFNASSAATKWGAVLRSRPIVATAPDETASNAACPRAVVMVTVCVVCTAVNELSEFVVMVVGDGAP